MNIAIITVYQPFANLGSFLQAYALKIFLEKHGHNVKFIKSNSHLKLAIGLISKARPYRSFFLRIQKVFHSLLDLKRLSYINQDSKSIDCYIWGSDEIWNVTNSFFCQPVFWGIGIHNKPKIGYAISAGHATNADFALNSQLTNGVKDFNLIYSRDYHTQKLLFDRYGINTDIVVDPTLLVKVGDLSESIQPPKKKYLLVYTYGIDKDMIEIVKKFANKYDLQIVSPFFWHLWADKTIECSALQFSTLIANAEFVFTTTFHGAIFSLINHTRCCILPLRPKVKNLCETLKCEDRLISTNCTFDAFEQTITKPFATTIFEKNLENLRSHSADLLLSELNHIENEKNH